MKIELEISEDNECTSYPWWMIVTPRQNFSKGKEGVANIAMGMISGPFFSRESAQRLLDQRRHHYGSTSVVWCASGHDSPEYRQAIDKATRPPEESQ